jgi:tetratricopeptide (TPR) repeat protein
MIIKSEYIRDKLSYIESKVKNDNKQHLFNINTTAEDIFMQILNDVYDLNLSNANDDEKDNFPAIDLIDRKKEIVFQVTSETSAKKVREDTIEKFSELVKQDEYKKYADYKIKMFYIKNKPNFQKATLEEFAKKGVPKAHLLGIEDINKEVSANPDIAQKVFKTLCKIFHDKVCDSEISPQLTIKSSTYDSSFVGREDEIKAIDKMLTKSNSMLLINGIGGIGKSSLANHYLYIREKKFDYYGFIDGLGSFVSEFRISLDLKSEKEQELNQEVIHKLQKIEGKKLLVIDNVEDIEANKKLIEMILSLVKYEYKILFTSRRKIKKVNSYHLGTLLFTDAQKLFLSYYPTDEIEKVDKIIGYLGLHTLFIKLVAETVENEGYCLDDILAKFENGELSKIEFIDEESGDEITFNHNLQELFSMQNLKDEYILLLKRLAVLPSVDIELNFLEEILGKERLKGRLNFLVGRGWLIENEGSYKLHQIIKEFVLANYMPSFEEIEIIVDFFINIVIQNDDIKLLIKSQIYINFLEELYKNLNHLNIENGKVVIFIARLARFYHEFGLYQNAELLYTKTLNISKNILNNDESLLATIYNNLAELYRIQEINNDMIEILFLKSLEINIKIYEENNSLIAGNCNNLGLYYISQGYYEKALKFLLSALKIYNNILDKKDLKLVRLYNNISECYRLMNNNREASFFSLISLNILIQNFEITHPDFANLYNTSGLINISLGDYTKAEEYFYKSLNINKYNWGNNHITTAQSYFNLGILFRITKNEKALENYYKSLVIRERIFGKIHLSVAENYYELSSVYFEKKDYKKAYFFLKNVVEIYKKKFSVYNAQFIILKNELIFLEEKILENKRRK